jgi:heterokaryon incompatibility protein (HET)
MNEEELDLLQRSKLCRRCRKIDWDQLEAQAKADMSRTVPVFAFSKRPSFPMPSCQLCRLAKQTSVLDSDTLLIFDIIRRFNIRISIRQRYRLTRELMSVQILHLYAVGVEYKSTVLTELSLSYFQGGSFRTEFRLSTSREKTPTRSSQFQSLSGPNDDPEGYAVVQTWPDRSQPGVFQVRVEKFDCELLKDMLCACIDCHGKKCTPDLLKPIPGFRLIDCVQHKIVLVEDLGTPLPPYLTLSYVWGSSKHSEYMNVTEKQTLPKLPQTVADAVTVTLSLGYRYLVCVR